MYKLHTSFAFLTFPVYEFFRLWPIYVNPNDLWLPISIGFFYSCRLWTYHFWSHHVSRGFQILAFFVDLRWTKTSTTDDIYVCTDSICYCGSTHDFIHPTFALAEIMFTEFVQVFHLCWPLMTFDIFLPSPRGTYIPTMTYEVQPSCTL